MIEFKMPALGADMDEGTLDEWLVKPGDKVTRGQIVAVVETTKAAVEIECWQEGTVGWRRFGCRLGGWFHSGGGVLDVADDDCPLRTGAAHRVDIDIKTLGQAARGR